MVTRFSDVGDLKRQAVPNKAKSKSQFRLFRGIASGNIAPKGSLTKEKAAEMVGHQSSNGLPEKKKPRVVTKFKRPDSK